ncbi:butyrate kinase [Salsuginibacillus kocurii]|uniref:butyrate kinase n=1 Tax=Salsuginibacillus kocurii TaxID=427078 RepID=UPI00037477FF
MVTTERKSNYRILTINPGSTTTKIGVYENGRLLFRKVVSHERSWIGQFDRVSEQLAGRKDAILEAIDNEGVRLDRLHAIAARGGLLRPLKSGTYHVDDKMISDVMAAVGGEHASNLGPLLAQEIACPFRIPSFIVDPVVVDEMTDLAKVTGWKNVQRKSVFHALNQKAAARFVAYELGVPYENVNMVVAHLGGGITIGAHQRGRVIDVNDGLNGEGPFSPERSGSLPAKAVLDSVFAGDHTKEELVDSIIKKGGFVDHFGTHEAKLIEEKAMKGDKEAELVWHALSYQIAKWIGAQAAVLNGRVDAIILTGGLAHSRSLCNQIRKQVNWISQVYVRPGEDELQALAEGALRVLNNEEEALSYEAMTNK